jgi:RNA polymerase sigma-70 factor (ECF subfamily)
MSERHRERYDRLMREHGRAISRTVASFARPGADQDDLGQEVALALWGALPHFRGECAERTFVLRVAHNRGLDHLFRRKATEPDPPEVPDPRPGPDVALDAQRQLDRLFQAVRLLPLGQRQVLTLSLEGLPHADVGAVLGITAENVAVRLGRAREALRALLREQP